MDLKVATSNVAMHMPRALRDDIFKQVDRLLDFKAWDDDSSTIGRDSFLTFLRFVTWESRLRRPALTVAHSGNIMASWLQPSMRLTVEFFPADHIQLVAHRMSDGRTAESISYSGHIKRIDTVLASIDALEIFRAGGRACRDR